MDKKRTMFNDYMAVMGEVYDREFTRVLIESYWQILRNVDAERLEYAFKKVLATCKFFPRPAEILEHIFPDEKQAKVIANDCAQQQAYFVLDIVRGRKRYADLCDPVTVKLMSSRFNIDRLKETMLEKDERWFVKDFVEAYVAATEVKSLLEIDGACGDVKRLAQGIGGEDG